MIATEERGLEKLLKDCPALNAIHVEDSTGRNPQSTDPVRVALLELARYMAKILQSAE